MEEITNQTVGGVVFVDWFETIAYGHYWRSVTPSVLSRYPHFADAVSQVFATETLNHWMRGHLTTKQIIRHHFLQADDPELVNLLAAAVQAECAADPLHPQLVEALRTVLPRRRLVLASDNMDCAVPALTSRLDMHELFCDFLISSELGVLKAQDPDRFFGPWLAQQGMRPHQAVLIDDRIINCRAFEAYGGAAILFDHSDRCWAEIATL